MNAYAKTDDLYLPFPKKCLCGATATCLLCSTGECDGVHHYYTHDR